jgi:hypothetical protein
MVCNGDILLWYKRVDKQKYPSIALLARTQLGQMGIQGYQERLFSSANAAVTNKQGRVAFDVLEKRTLLFHNSSVMESIDQNNLPLCKGV